MLIKVKHLFTPIFLTSAKISKALSTSGAPKIKEESVNVKNWNINYVKVGTGAHNVLFLPGALGTIWTESRPQIEGFNQDKFTLVVWDPPGYGKSRPPEKDFTVGLYEKDADMAYEFMKKSRISIHGQKDKGNHCLKFMEKNLRNIGPVGLKQWWQYAERKMEIYVQNY